MSWVVEIIRNKKIGNMDNTIFIDKDGSEYTAFSFDAMWRGGEIQWTVGNG